MRRKKRIYYIAVTALTLLAIIVCGFRERIATILPLPFFDAKEPLDAATAETRVETLLGEMTTREKVGQLFLVRCPVSGAAEKLADYPVGGVVLFAENTAGQTRRSLRLALQSLQKTAVVPLLVAVDEEGGSVNRLSVYSAFRSSPFPAPSALYLRGGWAAVAADTAEKCRLFRKVGVNVNLAPVCDVCGEETAFMYARSFSGDAAQTAEYVRRVVGGYAAAGVGCVLKHFPGYGDNADTHTAAVMDTRSLAELEARDLLPFRAGIEAGAPAVLVSHMLVTALDAQTPASLSAAVHRYLRQELGFEGVIITDDLAMSAVRRYADAGEAAVLAVLAGNDLLCCSDWQRQFEAVLAAVESGVIPLETVESAAARVLRWKLALGLLE